MTDDQIERVVERRMDSLDRQLLEGKLSQADYDAMVQELDAWASRQRPEK